MIYSLLSFLYPFVHRVLSGMQSMYGYDKTKASFIECSILLLLFPLFTIEIWWVFFLFFVLYIGIVFMKTMSFNLIPQLNHFQKYRDIHLWENLVTGSYWIYLVLAGFNILLLICAVYPALIIHKGLINIGSGLSFFATATDDPTGKTYGFKLFGFKIKRSSNTVRLIFTALSLIAAYFIIKYGIVVSL